MGDIAQGFQADEVARTPGVGDAGDGIADLKLGAGFQTECTEIQVDGGLTCRTWIQVHHHEHGVTGEGINLGVDDDLVIVGLVEVDIAQLLECRVGTTDLVEGGQIRLQGIMGRQGTLEVARAQFVLL